MKFVYIKMIGIVSLVLLLLLLFTTQCIVAQGVFESNAVNGNWDTSSDWTLISGSDGDGIPDADDNVTILGTDIMTIDNDVQ